MASYQKENANCKVGLSLGEFSLSVRETWLFRKERQYRQKSLFFCVFFFTVFWQSSSTVIENISSQRSPQLAPAFANDQELASALMWWLRAVHGRGDWKPWPCSLKCFDKNTVIKVEDRLDLLFCWCQASNFQTNLDRRVFIKTRGVVRVLKKRRSLPTAEKRKVTVLLSLW